MNRPTNSPQSSQSTQLSRPRQNMGSELPEAAQFGQAAIALLQQGTQLLDPKIRNRLYEARLQALRSQKIPGLLFWQRGFASAVGGHSGNHTSSSTNPGSALNVLMWLAASAVVIFSLMAITDWQQESRLQDLAVLDAAILTDEVPPNAYADSGFLAFLKANRDSVTDVSPDSLEPATTKTASPS